MQRNDNEASLSPDEQARRNRLGLALKRTLNGVNIASIPVGMLPFPTISASAEVAGLTADTALKFTKPYLVAPPDVGLDANFTDPAAGNNEACYHRFELPQTMVRYQNFYGIWPQMGDDLLHITTDEAISFGVLGVPDVRHLNTDARFSVHGPSAGIYRLAGVLFDDAETRRAYDGIIPNAQTIFIPMGRHRLDWRAESLWYPFWDTAFPTALSAVLLRSEFKEAKRLKELKAQRARKAADLLDAFGDTKVLKRQLQALDDKIRILEKIDLKKVFKNVGVGTVTGPGKDIGIDYLAELISYPVATVYRERSQWVSVFDQTQPTIEPIPPQGPDDLDPYNPVLEASDIGGARMFRYRDDLAATVAAFDNCAGMVTLTNDIPSYIPLETPTVVTWTATDDGPVKPGVDHDGDGLPDDDPHNSITFQQTITVLDTQAPILVPPPGLVFESAEPVDLLNDEDPDRSLGQPLVSDLADLHPVVSRSSFDDIVQPGTRTIVTWSAADSATPPNVSTGEQLVTVKLPGSNNAPEVQDRTTDTLTSMPVDLVLTGFDPDELPLVGDPGGLLYRDPLQFGIEQRPQNGEFIAPLKPFFIDDFRTDKVGGLERYFRSQPDSVRADYELALQRGQRGVWLDEEFCNQGSPVPVDFVLDPLYVHVRDDGEQFFFDHYYRCDPDVDTDIAIYQRISRWAADNQFLGHVVIPDNSGNGIPENVAAIRIDADDYVNYVNPNTGSASGQLSLQRCPTGMTDMSVSPPNCQTGFFGVINQNDMSDGLDPTFAIADIEREVVYISTNRSVDVADFRHQVPPDENEPYDPSRPRNARALLGALLDTGGAGFMGQGCTASSGSASFENPMELDSEGNLYVVDNDCDRIHKFTPSYFDDDNLVRGTYVGWMGRCTGSTNLACDDVNERSKGFSCTNATCSIADGIESGNLIGQFLNPSYVAIDPNDIVYIADYGNQRVQRFDPDGTFAGQAQSTGDGINAQMDGGFVLGNMGPPKHVSVNSEKFFVVDQSESFVHVFDASPFSNVTEDSATVTYVSNFDFHSAADTFQYTVNDGLVDSNTGTVTINVARNYRQPVADEQSAEVLEDRSVAIILRGSDPDGIFGRDFNGLDELVFDITVPPKSGTLVHGGDTGGIELDAGMDVWTYTPNTDYFGDDSFTFTISDAFTDETLDGATPIPEPYGPTDPVVVPITVHAVNDVPTVEIDPLQPVAAGFPFLLAGTATDDFGSAFETTLLWGDGTIDRNGETVISDNGTPNDPADDTATMTGVVFSTEAMEAMGETPVHAMHVYTTPGRREIRLCMRDEGRLEACSTTTVDVEAMVAIAAEMTNSDDEIVDGLLFKTRIGIRNGEPVTGATGLAADDVTLALQVPPEIVVERFSTPDGNCSLNAADFVCSFGTLPNGASVSVDLELRGTGVLVYDEEISFEANISTTTPAMGGDSLAYSRMNLLAASLDRDDDGLPNIFEAAHGVDDPAEDDDGDGLTNLEELAAKTSPSNDDTDGDGLSDGDEIDLHGSDPTNSDSDNDGIPDGDEVAVHGTNPADEDSDDDGLPDDWELDNGYNPLVQDSGGDSDGDGLSDRDEFANDSDHLVPDTDGDTLSDGDEVHLYGSDPALADSDDDGLDDGAELAAGTRFDKPDTDDDGLLDGFEVMVSGTEPLLTDTDRDGLPDGFENLSNRNALNPDYLLAAGGLSSCAITDNGVECWGNNDDGQAPSIVPGLNDPLDVTVGSAHVCALDSALDGSRSVTCWGDNVFSQTDVPVLNDPLQVAAGSHHTCALDRAASGEVSVACWGNNDFGQLDGPANLVDPIRLDSSISGDTSCVLDDRASGPELICWGRDDQGQIADAPVAIGDAATLALGSAHGCVVDGGIRRCWGLNDDGQAPPDPVPSPAVQLALGGFHSCALDSRHPNEYTVSCWGRDSDGEGTLPDTLLQPLGLAAGSYHSCAFDSGSARCWLADANEDRGQAPATLPLAIDPDRDGIPTAAEHAQGTDPLDPDTDRDLIDDATEAAIGTDPDNADTDGDGLRDGEELYTHLTSPLDGDSDGDGMPDDWEIDNETLPLVADALLDADGDGLTNGREYENNTNPQRADTDDDGVDDFSELSFLRLENSGQLIGTGVSEAVALGDVDADGDLDAVVANRDGAASIWLNDGDGIFAESQDSMLDVSDAIDVDIGDIDQDGDLDIVFARPGSGQPNSIWWNAVDENPQGVFTDSGINLGADNSDAVQLYEEFGLVGLYSGNVGIDVAHGFLGPTAVQGIVRDYDTSQTADVALGDLDGNGLIDAFVVNRNQPNQVFVALEPLPFPNFLDLGLQPGNDSSTAVALGDLDLDGDLDAYEVVFGAADRIWINEGGFNFSDSGQAISSDGGNDVALADLDDDGDLDAVVANTGENRIWFNQAGMMVDSGLVPGTGTSFGIAAGDLDNDGMTDFFIANDGANEVWMLRRLDPTVSDTDADDADDGWEIDNGLDPLDGADGALDADGDGLVSSEEFLAGTDPNNPDSDGDGMPDGWERDNSLDPTVDDAALDRDRDGLPNLQEYQQGNSAEEDDVPPDLIIPPDVLENSTGMFTDVAIGTATAIDARDGPVAPVADDAGPYRAGQNTVTWTASDLSGNLATDGQSVAVVPQASFAVDQTVTEGSNVSVTVLLNGEAINYPVQVNYVVAGSAVNPEDHDAADGSVMISAGTLATIPVQVVSDLVYEPNETITFAITEVVNAVVGAQDTHTATIAGDNRAPIPGIVMRQQGRIVTTAVRSNGLVSVSATVNDPNTADTHTYDWSGSDSGVYDPARSADADYTIDPMTLNPGFYSVAVDVTDSGNPALTNRGISLLSIRAEPPELVAGEDSDGDGIEDVIEGYGDSDNDRVPDYLDSDDSSNVLPYADETYVIETQPGLSLRLGDASFQYGAAAAGIPESAIAEDVEYGYPNKVADFEILGVEPGASALVVVPLEMPMPQNSNYRKYIDGAWRDFVVDADNSIYSAPGGDGACPAPGDPAYADGVNPGDNCIQLRLQDGGPNDGDGTINGSIQDPGGVAVPVSVRFETGVASSRTVVDGTSNVVMLAFTLVSDSGDVELDSITLSATGSGDETEISLVRLAVDTNANGIFDAGEPVVGQGVYTSDDGLLQIPMTSTLAVPPGRTAFLVLYDF